jgi:anti-anti-sigma regulatory factor
MEFRNVTVLHRGNITLIAVPKTVLAAINESNYPSSVSVELVAQFGEAIAATPAGIILDLRDTDYLDHATVSVVTRLVKLLADRNKPRAICWPDAAKEILDVCGIRSFCPTVTDLDMAVGRVSHGQPSS